MPFNSEENIQYSIINVQLSMKNSQIKTALVFY